MTYDEIVKEEHEKKAETKQNIENIANILSLFIMPLVFRPAVSALALVFPALCAFAVLTYWNWFFIMWALRILCGWVFYRKGGK